MGGATITDEQIQQISTEAAPGDDLVVLETMPDCHRDSHRAARNWGQWPHNGSCRDVVPRSEAEEIVAADPDSYAEILEDEDISSYQEEVGAERTEMLRAWAREDAAIFGDEFPGESIGNSDWDAAAWTDTSMRLDDTIESDWETYREALHAAVESANAAREMRDDNRRDQESDR